MTGAPADPRRGAALFVILMLSALLAGLAGAAMRTGLSGARAAAAFADAARADELGRAAGDIVSYHIATADPDVLRGGTLSVRLPDAAIDISYLSESARIDVNSAPLALISALLAAAGAGPGTITEATGRIGRIRQASGAKPDPAPGASGTSASGDAAPPPAAAPAAAPSGPPAIQDVLQVADAWNLPEALARRILPALTVASKSTQVDPILADRLVLLALLGDETRADDYRTRRMQGFVNTDSALELLPEPSRPFVAFKDAPAVRAIARVTVARRFERRYEMVVVPGEGPGQAPVVVSWRKLL